MPTCSTFALSCAAQSGFSCENCGWSGAECTYRYILTLMAVDTQGSTFVTAFNDLAAQILGMKADELKRLKSSDTPAYEAVIANATWKRQLLRVRGKMETYATPTRMPAAWEVGNPLALWLSRERCRRSQVQWQHADEVARPLRRSGQIRRGGQAPPRRHCQIWRPRAAHAHRMRPPPPKVALTAATRSRTPPLGASVLAPAVGAARRLLGGVAGGRSCGVRTRPWRWPCRIGCHGPGGGGDRADGMRRAGSQRRRRQYTHARRCSTGDGGGYADESTSDIVTRLRDGAMRSSLVSLAVWVRARRGASASAARG